MSGVMETIGLAPEEPEKADPNVEQAKLRRERQALMARSQFDKNTTLSSGGQAPTKANVFRTTLGK